MLNLAQLFIQALDRWGERPFLTYLEGDALAEVSFTEAADQIRAWAAFLHDRGVRPGDRVAFVTPKSPHQIRAFYACWWIGAIAVPVCEALGDAEMSFVLRDAEPALLLADESMAARAGRNAGGVPVVAFGEIPLRTPHAGMRFHYESDDAVAVLIYTSGSTGMPKGVMLTHRNLYRNAETALPAIRLEPGNEVVMSLLPYWHSFGLVVEVVVSVMAGITVAMPRDKRDFRKHIGLYRPTVVLLVPRIADALRSGILKRIEDSDPRVQDLFKLAIHNASRIFTAGPLLDGGLLRMLTHHTFFDPFVFRGVRKAFGGRLKYFVSGGAPLDLEHQIFFKYMGLPVYQGYGLSESSPVVSVNSEPQHKLGSCGPVLGWLTPEGGGDFTFRDPETGETGRHVHGELLLRGDCVMKGYWRHTDTSAKVLRDGWLHTGDMGYLDADGFLYIEGRRTSMLVLEGGEKLHPEHVEDAIKSVDLFADVMVIGDRCKNVYACVTLDKDAAARIPADRLQAHVREKIRETTEHLAAFQRPRDVLILPPFSVEDGTVTVTLKIRRHRIWERHGDEIRAFLAANGEESAVRRDVGIASSKVLESLGKPTEATAR